MPLATPLQRYRASKGALRPGSMRRGNDAEAIYAQAAAAGTPLIRRTLTRAVCTPNVEVSGAICPQARCDVDRAVPLTCFVGRSRSSLCANGKSFTCFLRQIKGDEACRGVEIVLGRLVDYPQ
jgi:hypothetical protein